MFLKRKSDFTQAFEAYLARAEKETGQKLLIFHSDRGGEYMNTILDTRFKELGITHHKTMPYTPQQNGRAERWNRTFMEKALSMLHHAGLSLGFWQLAVDTAVHVYNRTPTRTLKWKTPMELWSAGHIPDVSYFRVFGCKAYVHTQKEHRHKLEPNSKVMTFVGYEDGSKGYRFWHSSTRSIVLSGEATFDETSFPSRPAQTAPLPSAPIPPIPSLSLSDLFTDEDLSPQRRPVPAPVNAPGDDDDLDPDGPEPKVEKTEDDSTDIIPDTTPHNSRPHTPPPPEPPRTPPRRTTNTRIDTEALRNIVPPLEESPPAVAPVTPPARPRRVNAGQRASRPGDQFAGLTAVQIQQLDLRRRLPAPQTEGMARKLDFNRDPPSLNSLLEAGITTDPRDYSEAMSSSDSAKWREAAQYEIDQLHKLGTWELVDRPKNRKIIKNRWVFKAKTNGVYRARLVAKGFTQVQGVDYTETFSPVARFETLRLLLALAALWGWEIHGLDVKSAFLHGKLDEEIFMEQPEGFVIPGLEDKVARLLKTIYGLKQASRVWNVQIDAFLKEIGFTRTYSDTGVYVYRRQEGNIVIMLVLYVDDMAIMGNSLTEINRIKVILKTRYEMSDLGELKDFLGIRITRDRLKRTLRIDQKTYLEEVLERFGMTDANPARTPLPAGCVLTASTEEVDNARRTYFQSLIGSMMYFAIGTRPDVAYAVARLAQYSANPTEQHLKMAKYVLRYVKGTLDYGIVYDGFAEEAQLLSYTDSDYAENRDDRHSISAYVFKLAGGAISWMSRKQSSAAQSTAEAEYISMAEAAKQLQWYYNLYSELGLPDPTPIDMRCDNRAAILTAENPMVGRNMKHVEVKYHFIREAVQKGLVRLVPTPSAENVSDALTKSLPQVMLDRFSGSMGLIRHKD